MASRASRSIMILAAFLFAVVGVLVSYGGSAQLSSSAGQEGVAGMIPEELPPIVRGAQTETDGAQEGLITLSFDDGTCESGLGVGAPHTALVEFDVPGRCTSAGVSIVRLTARVNTGTATAFTVRPSGPTPGPPGSGTNVNISNIVGLGPCPATDFASRTLSPIQFVAGTENFFAGINYGSAGGFVGRDTNSPPAMRQWLNCPTCGMSTYSPADITGIGFPGNFMIRVTVEDLCFPVELIEFTVKSK